MTESEAIKRIREQACNDKFLSIHCDDSCLYGDGKCEWAMAIHALQKQIPKKLISICKNNKLLGGYCPTCNGTVIVRLTFLRSAKGKCCDWCGQKIDLSDSVN